MKYGNETGHFVSDLKGEGFMNGIVGTFIVLAVLVVIRINYGIFFNKNL